MASKRKRRNGERRETHPRSKYCDNPPDFGLLASLYPTFQPYVFYSRDGRPKIDWTDFNATRELTRVLLLHDHGINWWIPDGQLCPAVPNRSNYIHWIEDLLASDIIGTIRSVNDPKKGLDIGTGANCIYPLLGASILGWSFVGSDITDVAVEWANYNVNCNPQLSSYIEIRKVGAKDSVHQSEELESSQNFSTEYSFDSGSTRDQDVGLPDISGLATHSGSKEIYDGPPVLIGVIKEGEKFDFCMCNPPFFESMDEAGLNPKTSCGGTPEEMVCSGGELAFITRIIEDSTEQKDTFRWFTSMVGRKLNLNILVSKLWKVGATVVKTTEFVQGRTSRWGLAWSYLPTSVKMNTFRKMVDNNLSFILEGLQRGYSAFVVLQSLESYLASSVTSCKLDSAGFNIDVTASKDQIDALLKTHPNNNSGEAQDTTGSTSNNQMQLDALRFCISVFQQIPGTLMVKGTLLERASPIAGLFPFVFQHLEGFLVAKFKIGRELAKTIGRSNA